MIFSTSGVNKSRTTLDAVSRSSYTKAGAFSLSAILLTLFQLFNKELKSLTICSSLLPSATVLIIIPVSFCLSPLAIFFSLLLSNLSHIFFEIPI